MPKLLRSPRPRGLASAGLAVLVVLAAGCSTNRLPDSGQAGSGSPAGAQLAPGPSPEVGFSSNLGNSHQPLAVGHRWDYAVRANFEIHHPGEPPSVGEESWFFRREITGQTNIHGIGYFLQSEFDPNSEYAGVTRFAVREDAYGVYSTDLYTTGAPALRTGPPGPDWVRSLESSLLDAVAGHPERAVFERAAAALAQRVRAAATVSPVLEHPGLPRRGEPQGFRRARTLPGEIALLLYPLVRGSRWIVRDSPRFTRDVVGRERVSLPSGDVFAWVIRGESEYYGPNDLVTWNYTKQGLVRQRLRFESVVRDELGNPIGTMRVDIDQKLIAFTPAGALATQ